MSPASRVHDTRCGTRTWAGSGPGLAVGSPSSTETRVLDPVYSTSGIWEKGRAHVNTRVCVDMCTFPPPPPPPRAAGSAAGSSPWCRFTSGAEPSPRFAGNTRSLSRLSASDGWTTGSGPELGPDSSLWTLRLLQMLDPDPRPPPPPPELGLWNTIPSLLLFHNRHRSSVERRGNVRTFQRLLLVFVDRFRTPAGWKISRPRAGTSGGPDPDCGCRCCGLVSGEGQGEVTGSRKQGERRHRKGPRSRKNWTRENWSSKNRSSKNRSRKNWSRKNRTRENVIFQINEVSSRVLKENIFSRCLH
ncbi:uncharacterized protein V6R79_013060 [Siganus canaliculatus]